MHRLRILWQMLALLGCAPLWAIEVSTAVPAISHEGFNETIGSFTLTLRDDAFSSASPTNPIYIRFRLTQANGWSKTRVDQRLGHAPINLALFPSGTTVLAAGIPATAVQLVRLVKGEQEGWIKVTDSSSQWVLGDGGPTAPGQTQAVSFTLGIRGSASIKDDASTPSGGNEYADTGGLASTLLCADYQNTPNFGYGDLETIDLIAFNAATTGVETGSPFPGSNIGIGFSNDFIVGRGANYFPCFEFYFESNNYESLGFDIELSRMDLINRSTFEGDIPVIYLANSSDFDWRAGARLYLTQGGFNPVPLVFGTTYPHSYEPTTPRTNVTHTEITLEAPSGGIWRISPITWDGVLVAYEFLLTNGLFTVGEELKITGMKFETKDDFEYHPLKMDAYGFFYDPLGEEEDLQDLGPLRRTVANLSPGDVAYSKSVPFTAYDRGTWQYLTHVTNTTGKEAHFTALFYNPSSLLLGVLGNQVLAPFGKQTISIQDSFGVDAVRKYSWVYIVSDQPLALTGVIDDNQRELLDIYPGMAELRQTMFASHIPQDTGSWETTAYIVSSDPDIDASYYLKLPGSEETRIATLRFPSSTAIIRDNDFNGPSGRSAWFQVNATAQAGIGILFYAGKHEPLLASTPLDIVPQHQWRFDHVGNPANGWWNGLAVMNPELAAAEATLLGFAFDGTILASKSISIAGESNRVDTLTGLLDYTGDTPLSRIEVSVDEGGDVLCFLLLGQENRMTTVSGNLATAKALILPHSPSLEENWVGVALINPSPLQAMVSIQPLFPSGQSGPMREMSLIPSEKRTFALAELFSETAGYSHYRISSSQPVSGYALTGNKQGSQLATILLEPANP